MGVKISMPKLGLTMTKGKIAKWAKREGDTVKKGEVIAIIETEKITYELKAPDSGVLLKIYVPEKGVAPVGQILAYIGEVGEKPPEITPPEVKVKPRIVVKATPRAKRLAREKGIDLTKIKGSGPDGLILESDVLKEIEKLERFTVTGLKVRESLPLTPMRETIMKRMTESLREMAQVTITTESSADGLVAVKEEIMREKLKVTYTDLLVKIVAKLLKKHPLLNSTLEGNRIKIIDEINIGIAVAIDHGLLVPVIREADKKGLEEIIKELRDLTERARKGELSVDEVTGGTFTITNLGMHDIDAFTPIINPPQTAILGVGRIIKKPVVVDKEIKVGYTIWLSLTFDHRVLDGHIAADFLRELSNILKDRELTYKYIK